MSFNSKYTGAQVEALLDAVNNGGEYNEVDPSAASVDLEQGVQYYWILDNTTTARTINLLTTDVYKDGGKWRLVLGISGNKPNAIRFNFEEKIEWEGGAPHIWASMCSYLIEIERPVGGATLGRITEMPLATQNRGDYINFSVMDWNIKTSLGIEEHPWSERKNAVLNCMFGGATAGKYGYVTPAPDIIGLQEIYQYGTQWDDILDYIKSNAPAGKNYAGLIAYRGDTILLDSEGCAILYNTNKFDLISNGKFWLRGGNGFPESPDAEGTASWETGNTSTWTNLKRIAIWVILRDKESGKELFVLNTHYNPAKTSSLTSQYYSSDLVKKQINKLNAGRPTIFMGDLNCNPDTSPIKILEPTYDLLEDTRDTARMYFGETYTVNDWNTNDDSLANFDYIFTKGDGFKVNTLTIAGPRTQGGGVLSDHNALIVDIYLKI